MFQTCIKYFFILFCGFYLYIKLLNLKATKTNFLTHGSISFIFAILIHFVRLYFAPCSILALMFLFTTVTFIVYRQPMNVTIVSSSISLGCSYILFTLSALFTSPFALLLMQIVKKHTTLYDISFVSIGIFQILLSTIPFRFKRFKTGMPFLKQQGASDIGAFIAISLLIAASFFDVIAQNKIYILIPIFFIVISGVIIFFWWKTKLTENYIHKLKEREINTLQEEINQLKLYNETLSKIIHKDNKLIPVMELAVKKTLFEIAHKSDFESQKKLQDILSQLESIAKERKGILSICDNQAKGTYSTGSSTINSLLQYLSAKAYAGQINFEVIISQRIHAIIPDIISENDFRTLIADLAENALIAVKNEVNRNVLIHTKMDNGIFCIEFFDSGIPFSEEVLSKLGKQRITTHENDGGSGIGYMSTFEILRRCKASLLIDETVSGETYTKKVAIRFDGLAKYKFSSFP